MMTNLTLEELEVLKAIFKRNLRNGYEHVRVAGMEGTTVRLLVGHLHAMRMVTAEPCEFGWLPGNVTETGLTWMQAYGLKRRSRDSAVSSTATRWPAQTH